jgi:hypothetical protein
MSAPTFEERLEDMTEEKLRRKANQHWNMAGLARQDSDLKDAQRHTELARRFEAELSRR